MATPINTADVALSELETAPAGGGTFSGSNLSFETSGRRGWNEGLQGSSTVGFYTWGYGSGAGGGYADAIYGLNPPTTGTAPLSLGDWKGLQYWFDGSTFDITLKWQNNQTPPPPPPVFDAVSVQIAITDSSNNYSIFGPGVTSPFYTINFQAASGQSQAQMQISGFQADQYVLAKNLYWYISVDAQVDFTGGSFEFLINGTQVLFDTLPPGPFSGALYDWTTIPSKGLTNSGGCALEFVIG